MPTPFAQWLDITMSNRGITGRHLAKRLGVHDSAVSRWRSGQGIPSMDTCVRLATELDVDPLRLAVTAGHMDGEVVGIDPLALPADYARRKHVREQIRSIKGVDTGVIERLLEVFEREEENRRYG